MQLDNGRNNTMVQHLLVIGAQRFDSKRVIEVDRVNEGREGHRKSPETLLCGRSSPS